MTDLFIAGIKETISSSKEFDGWYSSLIFFLLITAALTEPFKVFSRKNFGVKSISMVGIIAGATVYLAYGLMLLVLYITLVSSNPDLSQFPQIIQFYFSEYAYLLSIPFYCILGFATLFTGMKKYYAAKHMCKLSPDHSEYRGDSIVFSSSREEQKHIWGIKEPKLYFFVSLVLTIVAPILGLFLLLSAISFWASEWYHIFYKDERARQSSIELINEIRKANELYNSSSRESNSKCYVSSD